MGRLKIVMLLIAFSIVLITEVSAEVCKNIYCYEFDYVCCCSYEGEATFMNSIELQDYTPASGKDPIMCPVDLDVKDCEITINSQHTWWSDYYYIGNGERTETSTLKSGQRWEFSSENQFTINAGLEHTKTLNPGQYIYAWSNSDLITSNAVVYRYELKKSGRAGSCEGIPVIGSVGCTFNPEGSIYRVYDEESESNIENDFSLDEHNCYRITSEGDKRICGSTCDDCSSDADCASQYPSAYEWNGRQLGGYCQNGQIVMYGCQETGEEVCLEFDDINKNGDWDTNEACYETEEKKECSLVKRITTGIECCTSDDCQGAGDYYCNWADNLHSECTLHAQCEKDSDCGTAVECNRQTMQIKEQFCNSEKQCEERILQTVECCSTADCNEGHYCNSQYKCEETPQSLTTCSDGIQNQGETGVDCGGPCSPCQSGGSSGSDRFLPSPDGGLSGMFIIGGSVIGAIVLIVVLVILFMKKPRGSKSDEDLETEDSELEGI